MQPNRIFIRIKSKIGLISTKILVLRGQNPCLATRSTARILFATAWLFCIAAYLPARSGYAVEYPRDYRKWVHVKSGLIGPQNPAFARYGGIHHIYANERAMEGYAAGRFPDGSVIVFDLLETKESSGATVEAERRFIDVMIKDSERYAETGGWGFEEFKGNKLTEGSLTAQERTACYSCHTGVKGHDFVFSAFRP